MEAANIELQCIADESVEEQVVQMYIEYLESLCYHYYPDIEVSV